MVIELDVNVAESNYVATATIKGSPPLGGHGYDFASSAESMGELWFW